MENICVRLSDNVDNYEKKKKLKSMYFNDSLDVIGTSTM